MTDEPEDEIDAQVEADIETLLNACIEYAQAAIEERGMFPPVAVAIGLEASDEEEVSLFEPEPEPEGEEQVQEAIEGLEDHLAENRHVFRAGAIAFDVAGEDGEWDAITVLVSHSAGVSVDIQLPYRDGEFGELGSFDGTLRVWS